jgi:hypothetical protein
MPLASGDSLYAVTLVSEDTCNGVFFANRLLWSLLSLAAMVGLLFLAVHLSRKFVRPISDLLSVSGILREVNRELVFHRSLAKAHHYDLYHPGSG